MTDDAPRHDPERAEPAAPRTSLRRRAAPLVLAVGIALVAVPLLAHLPREQTLVFRLDAEPIRRLDVSWQPSDQSEPAGGVTLSFPDDAPRVVRHRVTLPNGDYVLSIEVDRAPSHTAAPSATETSWVRRVSLEGGETVVPIGG